MCSPEIGCGQLERLGRSGLWPGRWGWASVTLTYSLWPQVMEKNFFRRLVNRKRCVVVLDGFYEVSQVGRCPTFLTFRGLGPTGAPERRALGH